MLVGKGWAFIHIPKCGGTTIRAVLQGREVADYLPMVPENTVDHRYHWLSHLRPRGDVFTVVRKPHRWLLSYWAMRSKEERMDWRVLDRLWSDDPDVFIQRVAVKEPGYIGRMFQAYTPWPGIKVHRLEDGLDWLRNYTDQPVTRRNMGHPPPISDESIAAISESESDLLARGYS